MFTSQHSKPTIFPASKHRINILHSLSLFPKQKCNNQPGKIHRLNIAIMGHIYYFSKLDFLY